MTGLPYAEADSREAILGWLDVFSGYVRSVDYASAAPMFHPDVVAFGTHRDVIPGLAPWIRTQWDKVWPKTSDFRFDLAGTHILLSADGRMATAIAPWTSTGYAPDGTSFDRPGRSTMVLMREESAWICVHSHMSLNRGVPQESYGNRPVAAWPDGLKG
jgi:ketosteroid isomerase-like protein